MKTGVRLCNPGPGRGRGGLVRFDLVRVYVITCTRIDTKFRIRILNHVDSLSRSGWKGDETHFHHVQNFSKNRLPRAIFFGQNLLSSCQGFPKVRLVNAWRVSNKIGGRLLTYRFPAKEDGFVRPAL